MIDVRLLVGKNNKFSIREQCLLLDVNRSRFYYQSKGECKENLKAMKLMNKHILEEPIAGVLTMQSMLNEKGLKMSYERVRRLMRKADIMPIYSRRTFTQRGENKYIQPYLLRDLKITHPNHIWQIDITYIPMKNGFMHMTAIIAFYSRYIVGWGLSNILDASESLKVLQQAVKIHGKPAIMNSDQGSQFTCFEYINYLKEEDIKISMDGKGRALDNIFIERFWRTLKYQYIYLNPKENGLDLYLGIKQWIEKYHYKNHQGINNKPQNKYTKAT